MLKTNGVQFQNGPLAGGTAPRMDPLLSIPKGADTGTSKSLNLIFIICNILIYGIFIILFFTLYNSNKYLKISEDLLIKSKKYIKMEICINSDISSLYKDVIKLQDDINSKKKIFMFEKLNCDNICTIQCNINEVIRISKLQKCNDFCISQNLIFDGEKCINLDDVNKFIKDVNNLNDNVNKLQKYNPILS